MATKTYAVILSSETLSNKELKAYAELLQQLASINPNVKAVASLDSE